MEKILAERWKKAIEAGSGQCLQLGKIPGNALVCNMHFEMHDKFDGGKYQYHEPSLFVRDNRVLQVISCLLCLRYYTTDRMFDKDVPVIQGQSLQTLMKKYYGKILCPKELKANGFFCDICVVRIDMTHEFYKDLMLAQAQLRIVRRKMTTEKVCKNAFQAVLDDPASEEEPDEDSLLGSEEMMNEDDCGADDVIVKEEPQLAEYDSSSPQAADEETESASIITIVNHHEANERFKCQHCLLWFNEEDAKTRHEAAQHGADQSSATVPIQQEQVQSCNICSKTFASLRSLEFHMLIHRNSNQTTGQSETFVARKKQPMGTPPYYQPVRFRSKPLLCPTCPKRYKREVIFEKHLRTHQVHNCKECSQSFTTDTHLESHMRIHQSGVPHDGDDQSVICLED